MATRANAPLPADAAQGSSFDVTDVLGANPAKAVRINARDGSAWAARLDWPDPDYPRTWVTEFYSEKRQGYIARYGAQLTCVVRGSSPAYDTTKPSVIGRILERLSAESDGWPLSDYARRLTDAELSEFIKLLYDPARKLPVVAISEDERSTTARSDEIARRLGGAAHIVSIPDALSWELTKQVGKRMSVFNGAVRIYTPGLSEENEDPFNHPLWMKERLHEGFAKTLAARVLPMGFLRNPDSDDFPRYALLRNIAATHNRAVHPPANQIVELTAERDTLKLQLDEANEERDAWQTLAQDEQTKRLEAEATAERMQEDVRRLENKAATLEYRLSEAGANDETTTTAHRKLLSYDDLEEWADEVLGIHVYIHQAALKDCKKNGHQNMLDHIETALLVIRDYVVPAKMSGGLDRVQLAHDKLQELGMIDAPCFVNRDEARRTNGYTVSYEGQPLVLADHIKYGTGYNNANQIRIYYCWDRDRERFVIGKMPTHLRNNLTN
jgi:hypothetical protein